MKRISLRGKVVGLLLMAVVLASAGCKFTGSSNGSSEAVAPVPAQIDYQAVSVSLDLETGDLDISGQPDGQSIVTSVDGHPVEITYGNTSSVNGKGRCNGMGPVGDFSCWIKLINRDPASGMYNISLNISPDSPCVNCDSAVVHNADNVMGDTTRPIGGANVDTPIPGSGVCYAEDGNFKTKKPYNPMGCSTYTTPQGRSKPMQALHPACGQRSERFDFGRVGSPPARFTFVASVSADYFPWNPLGADGLPNTSDDDPRYDFQNYSTIYLILTDLADAHPGSGRYLWGSWKRSNPIAGWGSPGNVSGVNLAPGSYFGVNVAIEAPDRVENYYMADVQHLASNPQGYEFYFMGAVFFRYNPFVIERVRAAIHPGKPYVKKGAQDLCITPALCQTQNYESYSHLEPIADGLNSLYGFGWVSVFRNLPPPAFKYYAATTTVAYNTDNGGVIDILPGAKVCQECGQKGFAKMNRAFLGGTIDSTNTSAAKPAFTREGPDAAPENTWAVYHFYVRDNPGGAGLGSEIRADLFSSFTAFNWGIHISQTSLVPGGYFDWGNYCYPFFTGAGNVEYCQKPANPSTVVLNGREKTNPNIGQSGEAAFGAGGIQAWNTYICVQ